MPRGKEEVKKLSMSSIETASLRDENSESESDSDDRFKAHAAPGPHPVNVEACTQLWTLELELLEWQERELFEYFVVVSLKKKPSRNTYLPEVSYQFPKLDRPTKQMREAEERLKAIPQFCFPDAKDWLPVSEYSSETLHADWGRRQQTLWLLQALTAKWERASVARGILCHQPPWLLRLVLQGPR